MKTLSSFFVLISILFGTSYAYAQAPKPTPPGKALSAREIAAKVLPSVVIIITYDENDKPIGQGSGFVYRPGLVVSNLHVFERATTALVKNVVSGKTSKAISVVAISQIDDICIIRTDDSISPVVAVGDSKTVRTGDEVFVASNPKGLEGSFTKGIVSSVRSDIGLFQIDAAISPGSSGGVLLNQRGEAIGIIKSSLVSGQNLNFAIPTAKLLLVPQQFKHTIQLAGSVAYSELKKQRLKGPVVTVSNLELPADISTGARKSPIPVVTYSATFDREGNVTEQSHFDIGSGAFMGKTSFRYGPSGLLSRQIITSMDGKVEDSVVPFESAIEYAIDTRRFSIRTGTPTRFNVYDSEGNIVQYVSGIHRTDREFDGDGLEQQIFHYENDKLKMVRRFKYKFDRYGNWIEKIVEQRTLNVPSVDPNRWLTFTGETEFRKITYY